jgi:hypothetical protein
MEKEKISTDFYNYGTFPAANAEILKGELEKSGVPVKIIYPGTNTGKDATAGAAFLAYQLMIRGCDFEVAEKIRKDLNIEAIKSGQVMPFIKPRWLKFERILLYEILLFLVSMFVLSKFEEPLRQKTSSWQEGITVHTTDWYSLILGYFMSAWLLIYLVTAIVYVFKVLKSFFKAKD